MLKVIKELLKKVINDIDAGNSNLTEEECFKIIDQLKELTTRNIPMSKYMAYTYLNMSRATFDNYVKEGVLPEGKKVSGFKEKQWFRKDLDSCVKKLRAK